MAQQPKTTAAQGTQTRTTSTIDLIGDLEISKKALREIQNDVGDFLVSKVLESVHNQESPVSGEGWPKLSENYAKLKRKEGGVPAANMELTGDMLNSLDFKPTAKGIEIGFFDSEAWKADGHLKFSGEKNNTPKRRFLPDEGQKFKSDINQEIQRIIAEKIVDTSDLSKDDFKNVETKSELYDVLESKVSGLTRSQIRDATMANEELVSWLDDLGILDLL